MSEEQKARFYSNWYYSGIRLLSSIEGQREISTIAKRLDLTPELVSDVIDFLVEHGLVIKEENQIRMGPKKTHLEASSPYIKTRQVEWRMKGFDKMDKKTEDELFFTAPISISKRGSKEVRQLINKFIQDVSSVVSKEKPEELCCLNIDFFKF